MVKKKLHGNKVRKQILLTPAVNEILQITAIRRKTSSSEIIENLIISNLRDEEKALKSELKQLVILFNEQRENLQKKIQDIIEEKENRKLKFNTI